MALYENGKRISGIRDFPAYTWAEYHALPVAKRPKVWKCTDRDYTDVLTADDIQYNGGTVDGALDSLTASMANTFVELGSQNGIGAAWDALTVYDRPVLCAWSKNGRYWGLLYKYTGGQYGMGISQAYFSTVINVLSVSGGTKTIKALTAQ